MYLHVPVRAALHGPAAHTLYVVCSLAGVAKPRLPAQATKPLFMTTHGEKFSEKKKKKRREIRSHQIPSTSEKRSHLASISNPTRHVTSAMTFLILTETSAGYALFKAKDKKLLRKDDLASEMSTPEGAAGLYVALSTALGWTIVPREL